MHQPSSRLESLAFYIFLATVTLLPMFFWPSPYISLDLVKTIIVTTGVLSSSILFGLVVFKERKLVLPPKGVLWSSVLILVSLVISAFLSLHLSKSIFGQGFEIGTASFIWMMFLSALVAFTLVQRKSERAIVLYVGMVVAFVVIYLLHALRFIFGPDFLSFSILSSVTSTVLGNWYSLSTLSAVVAIVAICAIILLPLSRRMKSLYWIIILFSSFAIYLVNDPRVWKILALVFAGLAVFFFIRKKNLLITNQDIAESMNSESADIFGRRNLLGVTIKSVAWIPLVACLVAILFSWKGTTLSLPVINNLNANHLELSLPWRMTLDVTSGAIKNYPLFGVGPNNFSRAYIAFKPEVVNSTSAWSHEFNYGFGLVPTFVTTQGVVGTILWIVFFVSLGIVGFRALRHLPDEKSAQFIIISSFVSSVFLWLVMIVSVPPHSLVFYTFVMTGIFFGAVISAGIIPPVGIGPQNGSRSHRLISIMVLIIVIVGAIWGVIYLKKTIALVYFGMGVKQLTVTPPAGGDAELADNYFKIAQAFDSSDIYWQARAEASLAMVNKLVSSISANASASTTEAVASQITSIMKKALDYSHKAIAYDPANYYNYLSKARVSEVALNLHMDKAYEDALQAYSEAIGLNPSNPSIYLGLARLQASQNKLDDALRTVGVAIQIKNNYLEAVFLLSQIEAARGDLPNAIIAAQFATQINPNNPQLFFQLGLLEYNAKNYANAAEALNTAIKLQPDYANAQYFLGLSYVRLGKNTEAIEQFSQLAITNPDNEEVVFILENLKAGKSPFTDAKLPVTPTPEKRATLPIKQKNK
jgi:tetratricopeptide (TPR) repeat protein